MNIRILSIIAILIVGMMIIPATAGKPSGNPIIDAILIRISNIENTLVDLQNQIYNIQLIPGPKGDQGMPGTPGANGLACWDLNGNDIGDVAEDINLDGNYDTSDCKGTQGEAGADGQQGPQGIAGIPGISGYETVISEWVIVDSAKQDNIFVTCPIGKTPIGGGREIKLTQSSSALIVFSSMPHKEYVDSEIRMGWFLDFYNPTGGIYEIRGYAICANVQ